MEREYHDRVNLEMFGNEEGKVKEAVLRVLSLARKHGSLNKADGNCGICEEETRRT